MTQRLKRALIGIVKGFVRRDGERLPLRVIAARRDGLFELVHDPAEKRFQSAVEDAVIIFFVVFPGVRIQLRSRLDHILDLCGIVKDLLTVAGHAPDREHRHRIVVAEIVVNAVVFRAVRIRAFRRRRRLEGIADQSRMVVPLKQISRGKVRNRACPARPREPENGVVIKSHRIKIGQESVCRRRVG